ncbi:MAG: outer membrane protein assembly factor [Xanthomonadales bacterium]|nr:outer membrane protein assembly factor [Xanthomonadales bacterium]
MRTRFPAAALWLILMLASAAPAAAAVRVEIEGIRGAALRESLERAAPLYAWRDRRISPGQARRLHAQGPDALLRTLEAFGYYRATVEGELSRQGEDWIARYRVRVGNAIRVRDLDIGFLGEGAGDPGLAALLPGFPLQAGDRLVHSDWERGKSALGSAIEGRGYLRARQTTSQVRVYREDRAADIALAWDTGPRYRYGETVFEGSQFDDDFMQRFVRHRPGQPYLADDLLALQRRLIDADYFAFVSVSPRIARRRGPAGELVEGRPEEDRQPAGDATREAFEGGTAEEASADEDDDRPPSVPIVVEVTPAPRHVFTGGVSIGTDSGVGVRGSALRRWVNRRGHRVSGEAELSQRRTAAAANYAMPRPGEGMRTLNVGVSHLREETDTSRSDTTSLYAMENRLWRGWLRDLGLRAMYGDFEVAEQRRNSTLVFAEGRLSRRVADDDLFPTHGWSLALEARAGSEALLSDTDFVQLRAEARLIHPLGERQRLHLRGQLGATWVDDFDALPPPLRFYAGGDRTVRGYGFQTLGPEDEQGRVLGGEHLAVASVEFERDVARDWAVATFVDSGNAYTQGRFRTRTGIGAGVRWRSPVGTVRLDIAHGLDGPDRQIALHLVIGPSL